MSQHIEQEMESMGFAQVIVVLKSGQSPVARAGAAASVKAPPTLHDLENYFCVTEDSQEGALTAAALTSSGKRQRGAKGIKPAPINYYPNLGVMLGSVNRAGLAGLQSDKRVEVVTGAPPLSLIRPTSVRAAAPPVQRVTWGIAALEIPKLWKAGLTGKGVLVGHLDTGADGRHPTLKTAISAFAEFDTLGRIVTPTPRAHDTADHGTHTAATIAGRPVGGRAVGVAPGAKLASAIVIEGGRVIARVLGGMDWAVGQHVRILSMSLGFRGWWEDFLPITRLLRSRNVLPVFAVGNEGAGTSRSPGNYAEALSVGASERNGLVADFSSSQRFTRPRDPVVPDLVAPGTGVISAKPGGGYQEMDGTSMATPHLAGLAALLIESRPRATEDQVELAIFKSCSTPPGFDPRRGSRGLPNGPRAVSILAGL